MVGRGDPDVVALAGRVQLLQRSSPSPGYGRVSSLTVFDGLIIATGPSGAWLRIGICIPEQKEWNAPMRPTTSGLRAYALALAKQRETSVPPACAVESSHEA